MLKKIEKLLPGYAFVPLLSALLVNMAVYVGVAQLRGILKFYSLELPIDRKIPFVAPFVLFYVLAFAQWVINYILIAREGKEFCYRFAIGDILAKVICFFFFLFYPTTLARPEVNGTGFCEWLVRFIYQMDAPVNLFPSIHCLESWCAIHAAFTMKKMPNWYRLVTVVMSLGVFASTLFIKQHVILDMFVGIAVFEVGYFDAGKIVPHLRKKVS